MRHPYLLSLSLISFLTLGACGTETASRDEITQNERIVGGQYFSDLPAVGALTKYGSPFCTGTLIGPRKVVTAAHCLEGQSASSIKFAIGPNAFSPEEEISASSIQYHPDYDSYNIVNDIGIVTLSKDASITPMDVVSSIPSSAIGTELLFVGYGVSDGYSQTGAGYKRAVYMELDRLDSTTFYYSDAGRNTCNGDSGGPAFLKVGDKFLVAGVTSYGDYNCTEYGVDTRVDKYLSFIGETGVSATEDNSSSEDNNSSNDITTPTDPCNGETYAGRCDGDTVIWCENDQVYQSNCGDKGQTCGYDNGNAYYACVDQAASDPCNGETYVGRCDGDTVIWCENETVKQIDCSLYGMDCGYSSSKSYYWCLY